MDSTDVGGSSYVLHVGHAAEAIALGLCDVALVTLAGRPRAEAMATGTAPRSWGQNVPDDPFEIPYGRTDRKSTRLNSSHANISYAVFCLKKTKTSHSPLSISLTP